MILENRDPREIISNKSGIRFNQIISEPKRLKSDALYWQSSTVCYERWRLFVYQCCSFLTGPCIANSIASLIGGLMFQVIWIITPLNLLCKRCAGGCEKAIAPSIAGCCNVGGLLKRKKTKPAAVDSSGISVV